MEINQRTEGGMIKYITKQKKLRGLQRDLRSYYIYKTKTEYCGWEETGAQEKKHNGSLKNQ